MYSLLVLEWTLFEVGCLAGWLALGFFEYENEPNKLGKLKGFQCQDDILAIKKPDWKFPILSNVIGAG